ncbi:MAG: exodeoxyribonuclease VII large subunit [Lachnospiraceae bacterium]|nr:exodeoxyribonuclease VII large subunit [Lachnospiraceae bacterium]
MQIFSVAQINAYIRGKFEQDDRLREVCIKGELSNVKYHTSGHIYFTLKDQRSTLTAVMFAGNRSGLSFQMKEGQQVLVTGSISVYERDGKYQIYATEILLDGAGILFEKYEKLKMELEEMGMFAKEYKRPIPKYIKTLGVVTAKTGAAVQDIINISKRRNPFIQIILYPAKVQGEGSAQSIVDGIYALEQMQVDTIIVGRGGGSIEDLWAFNEEMVARAIFDCTIPIISAVGHETDTTIADWVSDLRAPTPSAAAELAVFHYGEFAGKCFDYNSKLNHLIRQEIQLYKSIYEKYQMRLVHLSPENQIREKRMQSVDLEERISNAIAEKIRNRRHQLEIYIERMKGLSPLEKLNQGFALIENQKGDTINDVHKVCVGEEVLMHVKNGTIEARVESVRSNSKEHIRNE